MTVDAGREKPRLIYYTTLGALACESIASSRGRANLAASPAGSPNLNLTPDEKRVYGQLFRQADTDNVGVVTGEVAVKFFEKTRLDSRILGEVSLSRARAPVPTQPAAASLSPARAAR